MPNSWLGWYILFSVITTIHSLYRLYIPCIKLIKEKDDPISQLIAKQNVGVFIVFTVIFFVFSPIFFIISISTYQSDKFIEGFVDGIIHKK